MASPLSPDRAGRRRPLLVFSDDWGRHPSSSQHLVRHLLPQREVLWVNTIGTRPPRLDARTARRVIEKLGHWISPAARARGEPDAHPSEAPALAPRIVSPRMWPSFASAQARRLNRRLLASALAPLIRALPEPPIAITTLPIVADLVGVLPVHRWVYYCVDDFSQWPGYDGRTMQAMERELVPRMDAVIAVSETLVESMARLGARAELLTHGVELAHWTRPSTPDAAVQPASSPARIVFWGVVDRRLDLAWVAALGEAMERRGGDARIVLVGPQENPDPRLFALPRVECRPPVPYRDLPALAAGASVLVMPYGDMPATRAMQPLKLKEYLATGRPAVVRALPATRPWAGACDVCESPGAFVERVLERLDTGLPDAQRQARRALAGEDWTEKAARFERAIDPAREPLRAEEPSCPAAC